MSLYGEVQKEVIQATLADEYGLEVEFREATPIHVERPIGTGEAAAVLNAGDEPVPGDDRPARRARARRLGRRSFGSTSRPSGVPLYVYKTAESFTQHMAEYVQSTLDEGLSGWQVTDCAVTMTSAPTACPTGRPRDAGRSAPRPTSASSRRSSSWRAEQAGTVVCEPIARVRLEIPADTIGAVLPALARLAPPSKGRRRKGGSASSTPSMPTAGTRPPATPARTDTRRGRARIRSPPATSESAARRHGESAASEPDERDVRAGATAPRTSRGFRP